MQPTNLERMMIISCALPERFKQKEINISNGLHPLHNPTLNNNNYYSCVTLKLFQYLFTEVFVRGCTW